MRLPDAIGLVVPVTRESRPGVTPVWSTSVASARQEGDERWSTAGEPVICIESSNGLRQFFAQLIVHRHRLLGIVVESDLHGPCPRHDLASLDVNDLVDVGET